MTSVARVATTVISIHALLAESDANWFDLWGWAEYFYPRSPCGERRESQQPCERPTTYFYPRSPCGERPFARVCGPADGCISIHALLAESDPAEVWQKVEDAKISIHALLAESDNSLLTSVVSSADFYPRSPCGERPDMAVSYSKGIKISIHALLAESDNINSSVTTADKISIHALLAESDFGRAFWPGLSF